MYGRRLSRTFGGVSVRNIATGQEEGRRAIVTHAQVTQLAVDAPDEQGRRRLQADVVSAAFGAGAGARPHRVRVPTAAVTRAPMDAR